MSADSYSQYIHRKSEEALKVQFMGKKLNIFKINTRDYNI